MLNNHFNHRKFYQESIDKYSPDHIKALHWNSKTSQEKRFFSIQRIGDLSGKTILDVGCGTGDLIPFLVKQNIVPAGYLGMDLMPEFIQVAKKRYPKISFICQDFFQTKIKTNFDFVVCNGALNVREKDNMKTLYDFFLKALSESKTGVAITLLKECCHYIHDENLFYYEENKVEKFLQKNFKNHFQIYSDYADNDFSVFLYH